MKRWFVSAAVGLLLLACACQAQDTGSASSNAGTAALTSTAPVVSAHSSALAAQPPAPDTTSGAKSTAQTNHSTPKTQKTPGTTVSKSTAVTTRQATAGTTAAPRTVRVTIPEGYTLVKIFQTLEEKGVASFDALMQAAKTYDFSKNYPLVAAIPDNPYRGFKLEGYLFPSTYEFYINDKPEDAIGRMLRGSKANFPAGRQTVNGASYTMDEIIIIASLIEKEGPSPKEASRISAVIHNRLNKRMKLQLEAPKPYLDYVVKEYADLGGLAWEDWTAHNNTYKCAALPATPICNPGRAAVEAALHPADIQALFFCANPSGEYLYADTYEEHKANVALIQSGRK